jgi:hypothetical protein
MAIPSSSSVAPSPSVFEGEADSAAGLGLLRAGVFSQAFRQRPQRLFVSPSLYASSGRLTSRFLVCNHAWNRDSISTVSFAVVLSALGLLLASKARAFLAQVRDPNYGRSVTPAPEHYAQSYPQYGAHPAGPGYASQPYGSAPYAPPMGSSPPGGLAPAGPAAPSGLETDKSYSAGSGAAGLSEVSLATAHPRNAQDNPFADFERIPDHERVNKRYDV